MIADPWSQPEITPALRDYTQTNLERATHHFGDAVREADVLSVARNPRFRSRPPR